MRGLRTISARASTTLATEPPPPGNFLLLGLFQACGAVGWKVVAGPQWGGVGDRPAQLGDERVVVLVVERSHRHARRPLVVVAGSRRHRRPDAAGIVVALLAVVDVSVWGVVGHRERFLGVVVVGDGDCPWRFDEV